MDEKQSGKAGWQRLSSGRLLAGAPTVGAEALRSVIQNVNT